MHTHTRKVKLTCIGPRHQSVAACFRTCKSARVRVKMCKAARRTHSSVTARGKKLPSTRVHKYARIVYRARWSAFMLTACLEASSLDPCLGCRAARSLPADAVCSHPLLMHIRLRLLGLLWRLSVMHAGGRRCSGQLCCPTKPALRSSRSP